MTLCKSIFSLFFLCLLWACNNNAQNTPVTEESATISDTSTQIVSTNFTANYKGSIDHKYDVSMELIKFGNSLGGSYFYTSKGIPIKISGSIEENGALNITEYNNKGEISGYFEGRLKGNDIEGKWFNKDKSKSMPFKVSQTNIASLQTKSDVLSDAMGQYSLTAISGNVGANTMYDTYMENGNWMSFTSSNIGGERDGTDIKLTDKDIALLNNLHIVVDDNLTVHVYAGLIELLSCPFKADGMDYRIEEKDKSKLMEKMSVLSSSTLTKDNKYVLLADDNINFSDELSGNFIMVTEDDLILYYNPVDWTFELDIFVGSCCDGNTLTFSRK